MPLNPDRLTYSGSVHDIARTLRTRVREVSAALAGLDTDIVSARARDIAGDSWTPHVLLIDATGVDPADLDDLHAQVSALTEAGRVATAVVMTGGPPPAAPVRQRSSPRPTGRCPCRSILGADQIAAAALTDPIWTGCWRCSPMPRAATSRSHHRSWTSRGRPTWTTPVR